jgi:hypothetical protein
MTTKKIVAIVLSILLAVALLVGVIAGGIFLFIVHQVSNSDAAIIARTFLKRNDHLRQDIGDVQDFGWFVSENIGVQNGSGSATLRFKVIGAKKTVNATVDLIYRNGRDWRVTSASYVNEAGKTVELFNPYEFQFKFRLPEFSPRTTDITSLNADLRLPISNTIYRNCLEPTVRV